MCEHLRSTEGAALPSKEPFDVNLLAGMKYSKALKERISERWNKAASDNQAPLVVLFEDKTSNKPPNNLYFSVYEQSDHSSYSVFKRVIVTFNVSHKVFTCLCPGRGSCDPIMIGKMYPKQIDPDLISTPPWDIVQMLLFYLQFSYNSTIYAQQKQETVTANIIC